MKKKADKQKNLEKLRETLSEEPHVFLTGYEKMTVDQDHALRKTVRDAGGRYEVVKNNIVELAAKDLPSGNALSELKGMNSIVYTKDDPVSLAKALTDYAKENPVLTFKAGIVEGRVVNIDEIQALAKMPSREELLAKVLFLINAPATSLARALNGVGRNLAVVVDQGVKENKFKS
jgi:large subunit ribosomal protein L10